MSMHDDIKTVLVSEVRDVHIVIAERLSLSINGIRHQSILLCTANFISQTLFRIRCGRSISCLSAVLQGVRSAVHNYSCGDRGV